MNKKKIILGIVIFIILILGAISLAYYVGAFDNIIKIKDKSEENVLTDREYIDEIIQKMTYNEEEKIKSYTAKSRIIEEGTEPEEEIIEIVYDSINHTYKETYKHVKDGEMEEYTNYMQKSGDKVIEYRQDYDIETKQWYKETEILTSGDSAFYDEIWSGGISLSMLGQATTIQKVEENVYYIEFDHDFMKKRSENLYEVGDKATGKIYLNNGYITKIEMDATNFHLKENMTKRTVTVEITDINNTKLTIPQDIINSAKDIPEN